VAWRRNSASPSFSEIELTIGLPCTHFSPASITLHLELSIMTGTRAMSGSLAIRFRNRAHRRGRVEHRLVHVDVDDLRAVLHLLARDADRLLVLLVQDHPREGLRAGDVGALADVDEQRIVGDGDRLEAGQPHRLRRVGTGRGATPSTARAIARM
jgi:hypothetical protein